ncbi:MFS transporter [Lysinimonas soli]|uniref:MFS transporter n=1 Tax=Lysinimonas soli TaxID=1074233 RepID=A0ABW0NRT4_9MICO
MTAVTVAEVRSVRRRSRFALITGQALAGIGMGVTFSSGALLATRVSGSESWSGMSATMTAVGAAVAAVPLAALARRHGRAPALTTGALVAAGGAAVALVAAVIVSFPLLLVGLALVGVGTAVNLQSRFAATDLSDPGGRARDLAVVVWATTVGAVSGPNLIQFADDVGLSIGLPALTGPLLFTIVAQLIAATIYFVALRPDPLRLAARIRAERTAAGVVSFAGLDRNGVRTGVISTSLSHATMVAVMSMTPVHLMDNGASLVIVGVTISLHVAGMYAASPIWGLLADRLGRERVIAIGQGLLLASLLLTSFGSARADLVMIGLVLLGLGWSASTVAGSALISESADPARRTVVQGRADLVMSGTGAAGGALAGPILAAIGYSGLALVAIALVATVLVALAWRARRRASSPGEPDDAIAFGADEAPTTPARGVP